MMVGGPDTLSDNAAAGHLLTVLPFCVLFVLTAERRWVKGLAAVSAGFILNTFILCNSRGATVGFLVAGVMAIVLAGRQRRTRLMGFGAAGLVAMFLLADPQFIERQQTTVDATDGAARSRWVFWRAGVEMVRDNPLGVGARGFHALSPRYIGAYLEVNNMEERSGHNTYTQLAVAWGVQGTLIYLVFMLSTARLLHRVRRRATADPWYFNRSLAVEVALAGTMAAAFFSNRLYGESIYWMCSLAFVLYRIQATEMETVVEPAPVPVTRPDRVPAFASALSTTSAMKGS